MASSSLVVKISADLNDFTKQLDNMTRGVDRAAKKIEGIGKALTIGITLPVAAAAVALATMAAENEDTAGRMSRVFGEAAESVNASIQTMMSSVPEANTDLQKMAISIDNMAQGLGLAPSNAARMSESLLKLAGDASAFAHVPMTQALDALGRGLAGKTKGLLEFGIAIDQADIKQRAMSMGLLHAGNEITETGTALAAYSLIMERSSRIQGEAERTAGQMGKQFAFLKRDLGELADNVSGLVLPSLSDLARKARDVVDWFGKLDQSTVKTFFQIAAAAAVIGPAIVIIVRLVDVVFKARAALLLLGTTGASGFIAGLAALPFSSIVLGVGAIAAAVIGLTLALDKYKASAGALNKNSGIPEHVLSGGAMSGAHPAYVEKTPAQRMADYKQGLQVDAGSLLGGNLPTELAKPIDAMKLLEDRAHNVTDALKQMGDGWQVPGLTREWALTLATVQAKLDGIKNAMDPVAVKLRGIVNDLKDAASTAFATPNLPNVANVPGVAGGMQSFAPGGLVSRLPEPKVADLPGFTAANLAALRYADAQDFATEQLAFDYQKLRSNLDQFGIHLSNVGEKMQGFIVTLADSLGQWLDSVINKIGGGGKNASNGRGIGGMLGTGLGFLAGGPVGAWVGNKLGTALGGAVGGLMDHAKSSTDNAANSMNALAKTAERVNASISNMPQWFKIAQFRFAATAPVIPPAPPPTPYPTPSGGDPTDGGKSPEQGDRSSSRSPVFHIQNLTVQSSATTVKQLLADIEKAAFEKQSTGAASGFSFAFQG